MKRRSPRFQYTPETEVMLKADLARLLTKAAPIETEWPEQDLSHALDRDWKPGNVYVVPKSQPTEQDAEMDAVIEKIKDGFSR